MLSDYHLHTPLCHHAVGDPPAYVQTAQSLGLAEIGFSDHSPMPDTDPPFDDWRMAHADLPRYVDMILAARHAAAPFPVRLGLECDFIVGQEAWIEKLAAAAPWDYLIGSVHYLGPGWDVDNPRWIGRFTASDTAVEEIWTLYWQTYERCAASGLFDFLAHPDLPKKFGFRPPGDLRRYYEGTIRAAARTGVAVEVSTAGLHKPVGELYPSTPLLSLFHEAGLPVVVSSDAHAPTEVGRDFPLAIAAIRAAGYRETARFANRRRTMIPLE